MPSVICIGCRVNALVGRFQPLQIGQRRRVHDRFTGTVIQSVADKLWRVYWDDIGKCADHFTATLKYKSAGGSGTNCFSNINVSNLVSEHFIRDQRGINLFLSTTGSPFTQQREHALDPQPFLPNHPTTAAPTTTAPNVHAATVHNAPAPHPTNEPVRMNPIPPTVTAAGAVVPTIATENNTNAAATPPPTTPQPNEINPEDVEEEEVFDPNSVLQDIMEDN